MYFSDITEIFAKSQDPEELKHTWLEWHKAAGAKARENFTKYVELDNEAAKLNGKIMKNNFKIYILIFLRAML